MIGAKVVDNNGKVIGELTNLIRDTWSGEIRKHKAHNDTTNTDIFVSPEDILEVDETEVNLKRKVEEMIEESWGFFMCHLVGNLLLSGNFPRIARLVEGGFSVFNTELFISILDIDKSYVRDYTMAPMLKIKNILKEWRRNGRKNCSPVGWF